jgi:hypothetical protein
LPQQWAIGTYIYSNILIFSFLACLPVQINIGRD